VPSRALTKEVVGAYRVGLTLDEIVEIYRVDRSWAEAQITRAFARQRRRARWLRSAG
jgi:hypothetical protein